MSRILTILAFIGFSFGQQAFQSLEGAVGYIVIEKGGKLENYVVVSEKDGSVKTLKVDKNPSQLLKKVEDKEGGKK